MLRRAQHRPGGLFFGIDKETRNQLKGESHKGESKKIQTKSALRWSRFAINLSTPQLFC